MKHNSSLEHLLHLLRAVRYRGTGFLGKLMLRGLHVRYGPGLTLKGIPVVKCAPRSSIVIGSRVMLISYSSDTALAVNHAVKLETIAPGASIIIGDQVGMSGGTICAQQSITIGARTLLGANVTIVDTDFHPLAAPERWQASENIQTAPVTIGQNVFLGSNATVLRGVHIGDNSVIGAASVVTKDVPANVVAAGNPCKVIRFFNEEELRHLGVVKNAVVTPGRVD